MSEWDAWIGRETRQTDLLDARLSRQWQDSFDLPPFDPAGLPQGLHFCLCPPQVATAALGDDGHPARSDDPDASLVPVPLARRMWAGSSIQFHRPLKPGDWIERTSCIVAITEKDGGSGKLVFVEIDHVTTAGRVLAVEERQTLVY
ncbi:MAG TPA: MaoC family dehydratase N-terminal domain-containing protein, partial [Qipengyuania sp.]|nr:MaoC family dehydratase N-terminal domain-containing protein [Qipengyuania sp.]